MAHRIYGYDLIRTISILIVYLAHILSNQLSGEFALLLVRTFSPGLTMSLLGFISGSLLARTENNLGVFFLKRFSRIYTSLFLCLTCVSLYHYFLGKGVLSQHALLHFMGLTAFFEIFIVKSKAAIGEGLWFITAICLMYILLPLLIILFEHRRGTLHFILIVLGCTLLHLTMYGTQSLWNVFISFCLGVYLSVRDFLPRLIEVKPKYSLPLAITLLIICGLSKSKILPYPVQSFLFVFYPFAFVSLFFAISGKLPKWVITPVLFFASISYEFYILHYYFANKNFYEIFPASFGLFLHIIISFTITCFLSFVLSRSATKLRKIVIEYLVVC